MHHKYPRRCLIGLLLSAVGVLSACSTPVGDLTIVNNTEQELKVTLGKERLAIKPKGWRGVPELKVGEHSLTIDGTAEPLKITITEQRSTFVDPSAQSCYVVADYRHQYGPNAKGEVLVTETFKQQRSFTPKESLLVPYARKLPTQIPEGSAARRVHQVPCDIVDDPAKVAEQLLRVP